MRILHYLSGLPPVRGGGMIKYALDLAEEESKTDEVLLLLPGKISVYKKKRSKVEICRDRCWKQIPVYRIKNPLPIPMANGILDIERYTMPCDKSGYYEFLKNVTPDIIHIHTFMGMHAEFLEVVAEMKIATIYTTHDFFGICPTAHMICGECVCEYPGDKCQECSLQAFSETRNILEQSAVYAFYRRNHFLIKLFRNSFFKGKFSALRSCHQKGNETKAQEQKVDSFLYQEKYRRLLKYYKKMFYNITAFHFNSSLTRRIYEKYLGTLKGEVILISNKGISDNRKTKTGGNMLRLGFLGGNVAIKGLDNLQQAVSQLYRQGLKDIELHVYGEGEAFSYPFCQYHGPYAMEQLETIFDEMDVLVVPSCCIETFGMVVLEALSFGVPVLMTDQVGAQDILLNSHTEIGWIVTNSVQSLKAAILDCDLHRDKLQKMNCNIRNECIDFEYRNHVVQMRSMYDKFTFALI